MPHWAHQPQAGGDPGRTCGLEGKRGQSVGWSRTRPDQTGPDGFWLLMPRLGWEGFGHPAAELSLGSVNSGSLVHVCTFPVPIKREGDLLCSRSVSSCLKLQAGWAIDEAINRPGNTHATLVGKTGHGNVMLLHGTDVDG